MVMQVLYLRVSCQIVGRVALEVILTTAATYRGVVVVGVGIV